MSPLHGWGTSTSVLVDTPEPRESIPGFWEIISFLDFKRNLLGSAQRRRRDGILDARMLFRRKVDESSGRGVGVNGKSHCERVMRNADGSSGEN